MPSYIIKLGDYYLEWSTISDAPTTYGMKRDQFVAWYREEYGRRDSEDLDERLARVDRTGSSCVGEDLNSTLAVNRAGAGETCLSPKQILQVYCIDRQDGRALPVGHRHDDDGECEWGDA